MRFLASSLDKGKCSTQFLLISSMFLEPKKKRVTSFSQSRRLNLLARPSNITESRTRFTEWFEPLSRAPKGFPKERSPNGMVQQSS